MRILFINKYDVTGGAGIAAYRLHGGLMRYHKTENVIIAGIKRSDDPMVTGTRAYLAQELFERGLNQSLNLFGLQYFFFPFSSRSILKAVHSFKPDVISLHNLHGGYFKTSLLTELSQFAPLVWTLHDMWAMTANAAHTFGDDSWKRMKGGPSERRSFPSIGLNTGSWLLQRKKRLYANSRLTIVTPSEWLHELASQAPVFRGKPIKRIENGVDLKVFRPFRTEARRLLGLPPDAPVVLFAAEDLRKTEYKGGDDLRAILRLLPARLMKPVHALVVGSGSLRGLGADNLILHELGYVQSEDRLAACYSAADVFLYPTRADNLPSALIESAACGTPGVAFDVGGCKEIIQQDASGYLIRTGDIEGFVMRTVRLLKGRTERKRFSERARATAERKFSIKRMSDRYFRLFEDLTGSKSVKKIAPRLRNRSRS